MPAQHGILNEIVFGSSDSTESRRISRLVSAGSLRELAPRLYTTATDELPEVVVRRNWYLIAGKLFPGAVISHRTALENKPAFDGTVCLTVPGVRRSVKLPGLTIRVKSGPGPLPGDTPFMFGLHLSSQPRAMLENLQPSRSRDGAATITLGSLEIEERLDRLCRQHGKERLQFIRSQAMGISDALDASVQYAELSSIIGLILGTRSDVEAQTDSVKARLANAQFDPEALERLDVLASYLKDCDFPAVSDIAPGGQAWRNFAFFESYFTNYIEGTEFDVEEAKSIVFDGVIPAERPEDARDVLGTFRVVVDQQEMSRSITGPSQFIEMLKSRHATIMSSRPDKTPGMFKGLRNRAGSTYFVEPDLVVGTLARGYAILETLTQPFARAVFLKYLIVDVHPFLDGNGRTARIFMNGELVRTGETRILVPNVYRDNYVNAVGLMRRESDPSSYVRMMEYARTFSASLGYGDYHRAYETMLACNVFKKPDEARLRLPDGVAFDSSTPVAEQVRKDREALAMLYSDFDGASQKEGVVERACRAAAAMSALSPGRKAADFVMAKIHERSKAAFDNLSHLDAAALARLRPSASERLIAWAERHINVQTLNTNEAARVRRTIQEFRNPDRGQPQQGPAATETPKPK